ncbi:MAG: hypothetical protein VW557_12070 [Rhodospirillaceae bacterium]
MKLTDEQSRRRRSRNIAILALLIGLVCLFYAITIIKISGAS